MRVQHQLVRLGALGLMVLGCGGTSWSATLSGTITASDGRPVSGALVTIFNETKGRKETVFTAPDGSYVNSVDFSGKVAVRARLPYFEDVTKEVVLADGKPVSVDFTLSKITDPNTLSDSLTASAHLTKLQWNDSKLRDAFVNNCNACHQIGNATTRSSRDEAAWTASVKRMEFFAMLTDVQQKGIVKVLHAGMDGKPVQAMQKYTASDELSRAKIYEWHVGDPMTFVHDTDVGHDDKLYGTDEGHDQVWVLDRKTGVIERFPQPDIDLPEGGMFAAMQLPLGVFTGKHGPHSLAQGEDGRFWITNALSSKLMSFDPVTHKYEVYSFDESLLYPHTIRVDRAGVVWFTAAVSNKVVRFDPKTNSKTVIQLPHDGFFHWLGDTVTPIALKFFGWLWPKQNLPARLSAHRFTQGRMFANLPYGIDVNPKDGSIWYAKLFANKLGRIDPKTLAIVEYDTPLGGPRRPRFDKDGILWIPAFDDSALLRFDPATGKFETYKLPVLAPGEYETPYALNVHPQTGEIWITSNMSDRVLRFDPKSKTFIAYPSPTRVTWLRDMVFTKDGQVCSSSSNLPAYGIEDGRDAFFCLDPIGGEADRKAITAAAPK
jgi:virginiamycin B lyase